VLRAGVEILNPVYKAPENPEMPPKPGCGPQMKDCHDTQTLTVERGERGRDGDDEDSGDKREIREQQTEINRLEAEVSRMADKVQMAGSAQKKARTVSLAQIEDKKPSIQHLRHEAEDILAQVQQAEGAKKAAQAAAPDAEEKLLMKSVLSLSHDMHKIDNKVDHLATVVESRRSKRHGERAEHHESDEVRALKKRVKQAEQRARAEAKELSYEQSVPTPEYHYAEKDHTTPLFAHGAKGCGTLCKLKELVGKTRSNISKELEAAMK